MTDIIADEFSMGQEVVAWEARHNDQKATIEWTFTREKAENSFYKNQSYSARKRTSFQSAARRRGP
jgi:hypothetical protein